MEVSAKMIMALIPVMAIHVGLMIYSLRIINRTRKTRLLPTPLWVVIIVILNIFGSLAFLLFGRTYETD